MIIDFLLLPQPGSPQLHDLIASEPHGVLYSFLHGRKDDPPTMVEIRAHAAAVAGASHSQTDRRVRDLRDVYGIHVPCRRINGKPKYVLEGLRDPAASRRIAISRRLRARSS